MNLDHNDNSENNLIPVCRDCHGFLHGTLNLIVGDLASQREAMDILVRKGIPPRCIATALFILKESFEYVNRYNLPYGLSKK